MGAQEEQAPCGKVGLNSSIEQALETQSIELGQGRREREWF